MATKSSKNRAEVGCAAGNGSALCPLGIGVAVWARAWEHCLSPEANGVRPVTSTRTVVDAVRQSEGWPIGSVSDSQARELFFN